MRAGRLLFSLITLIGIAVPVAVPSVDAQTLIDPRRQYKLDSGGMSKDEAVQMAERRYNAKAVRVETINSGDRRIYEIRLLNAEGKVWTVRVDASTRQMF
jgi:uncharacterized membrane protein YkoI